MNNTGAAECFECPERHYCNGSFPRGYVECPIGHYCGTGTAFPTACPAGKREQSSQTVFLFVLIIFFIVSI